MDRERWITATEEWARWRPNRRLDRRLVLWVASIVIALVGLILVLMVLFRIGYAYKWTGFGQSEVNQDVRPSKTLWDWLKLLIVPAVLAVGGYLFTRSERQATEAAAERRAQDEALQAYLNQMGELLRDENRPLRKSNVGSEVRTLARAWTLTVLSRLDGVRKGSVVQFLFESRLIIRDECVVDLRLADLSGVNLSGAIMRGADLSETDLSRAVLRGANLSYVDLSEANLSKADLRVDLSSETIDVYGANLYGADLRKADLFRANLFEARLWKADLSEATGWTEEQLLAAHSLEGATMPNGQEYEDWLKSRSRGEDGEKNSGPS